MSKTTMTDKSGAELKAGDFIVYGHALGRCAGLRYGVVLDVYTYTPKSDWYGGKRPHARIRGVDDDGFVNKTAKLLSKDSTLQFGDRILKISQSQMPAKVGDLLAAHLLNTKGLP